MLSTAPNTSEGSKVGFEMLAKTIGKRWKELPDDILKVYKDKADEDMKRYKNEMEDYHQNLAKKRNLTLPPPPGFKIEESDLLDAKERALDKQEFPKLTSLSTPAITLASHDASESICNAPIQDDAKNLAQVLAIGKPQQLDSITSIGHYQHHFQELPYRRIQELLAQQAHPLNLSQGFPATVSSATQSSRLLRNHLLTSDMIRSREASSLGQRPLSNASMTQSLMSLSRTNAASTLSDLSLLEQVRGLRESRIGLYDAADYLSEQNQANVAHVEELIEQQRLLASLKRNPNNF